MERHKRRLQPEAHKEESSGKKQRGVHLPAEPYCDLLRDIGHIERARHRIDGPDPEQQHHGCHATQDEILEARLKLLGSYTERDKRVRRDRCDLQKHIEIEEVSRHNHPVHPGHHQHEERVVLGEPRIHLHVLEREENAEESDHVDRYEQQRRKTVAHQCDSHRRRPAAHVIHGRRPGHLQDRHDRQYQREQWGEGLPALLPPDPEKGNEESCSERDRDIER